MAATTSKQVVFCGIHGMPLVRVQDWSVKKVGAYYQFKHAKWNKHFWQAHSGTRRVYLVRNKPFGKMAAGSQLKAVNYRQEGTNITLSTGAGKGAVLLAWPKTKVIAMMMGGTRIDNPGDYTLTKVANHLYRIESKFWSTYWHVADTANMSIVKGQTRAGKTITSSGKGFLSVVNGVLPKYKYMIVKPTKPLRLVISDDTIGGIPISVGNVNVANTSDWEIKRFNDGLVQIRRPGWNNRFWQVSVELRKIWVVKGRAFGKRAGGSLVALAAKVIRISPSVTAVDLLPSPNTRLLLTGPGKHARLIGAGMMLAPRSTFTLRQINPWRVHVQTGFWKKFKYHWVVDASFGKVWKDDDMNFKVPRTYKYLGEELPFTVTGIVSK